MFDRREGPVLSGGLFESYRYGKFDVTGTGEIYTLVISQGYVEGTKLVISDGEVMGTTLGAADVFKIGGKKGSEMG